MLPIRSSTSFRRIASEKCSSPSAAWRTKPDTTLWPCSSRSEDACRSALAKPVRRSAARFFCSPATACARSLASSTTPWARCLSSSVVRRAVAATSWAAVLAWAAADSASARVRSATCSTCDPLCGRSRRAGSLRRRGLSGVRVAAGRKGCPLRRVGRPASQGHDPVLMRSSEGSDLKVPRLGVMRARGTRGSPGRRRRLR